MAIKEKRWELALTNLQERLRQPGLWYPYPAMISFALIVILTGHLLPGLNPRLGSRAEIIEFYGKSERAGAIWLGVLMAKDRIYVRTAERSTFSWSAKSDRMKDLQAFTRYLKDRAKKEALSSGLSLEGHLTRTTVVLAVDQRLKYVHIRPIIMALAEAGISHYAFETIMKKETRPRFSVRGGSENAVLIKKL